MTDSLTEAVRATLRYDALGNLTALREATGLSGHGFAGLRRGQRRISPTAARRIARVFATWARACSARADRITRALRTDQAPVGQNEANPTAIDEREV
jgi:hypothetical protein